MSHHLPNFPLPFAQEITDGTLLGFPAFYRALKRYSQAIHEKAPE